MVNVRFAVFLLSHDRLDIGRHMEDIHGVADNSHPQTAQKRAADRPFSAVEGHTADKCRRQRVRFIARPCIGCSEIDSRTENDAGHRTE